MDWKSSLEALKATLPQEEPPTQESNNKPTGNTAATRQPRLDIILDKKGRKGKAATIVAGFTIADNEIEAVSAKIKQSLGTGGSARGGEILIQGDKRKEVLAALSAMGFKARII